MAKERVWQRNCWAGDGELECLPVVNYQEIAEADQLCDSAFTATMKLDIEDWKQMDKRWANEIYGPDESWTTIREAGCGICAYAMCLEYYDMFDDYDSPKEKIMALANYAYKHGYREKNKGTSSGLFNSYTDARRFTAYADVQKAIDNGHPVILLIKAGWPGYESDGHFVLIVGYDDNGNYIVNDPGSNKLIRRKVEIKKFWKYVKAGWEISPKKNKL